MRVGNKRRSRNCRPSMARSGPRCVVGGHGHASAIVNVALPSFGVDHRRRLEGEVRWSLLVNA